MRARAETVPLEALCDGVRLSGEVSGSGSPVLLLHGLTATRRYVVHGSRALEAAGCRVIAYDARGHGESDPAPDPRAYSYPLLARDALCVLDAAGCDRAVLAGSSMGAATAVAVALGHPERVSGLVLITPAHPGRPAEDLARWDALSEGLRRGGPDGFLAAYGRPRVPERHVAAVETAIRQRLARHRHPDAVADALRWVPRSAAFDGLEALERLAVPTLVVGSRDELDPDHPLAMAEEWARRIPGARLLVEAEGETPLAWRGSRVAAAILEIVRSSIAPGPTG
jgi:pimeloyl-ACP methyl ester carboxylesterase